MKRLLLLAVAMCCISLYSCDNDKDLSDLSPFELEVLELDNLIASQSGFDEDALIADLCKGTMKMTSHYNVENGEVKQFVSPSGFSRPCIQTLFFENGTCRECFTALTIGIGDNPSIKEDTYYECDWRYDSDTRSIIMHYNNYLTTVDGERIYFDDTSTKVLYYNTETHRLILEGHIYSYRRYIIRMSGYIDVDPAERERIIEKYCNE
ncbi:MAG: hypothetical protein K2F95_02370 [Alistipes sp.]|nr:hypothetical protein [Alistipes sp.]